MIGEKGFQGFSTSNKTKFILYTTKKRILQESGTVELNLNNMLSPLSN